MAGHGTAVVTGAASGMGRATAAELQRRGYDVVRVDISPDPEPERGAFVPLDVTDDDAVATAMREIGDVQVLANVAGIGLHGPIERTPVDEARRLVEVNYLGPLRLIQAVVPGMRQRGSGTIVNVASIAVLSSGVLTGAYVASKAALTAATLALANEVEPFGIRVIIIHPGPVVSGFDGKRKYVGLDTPPYDAVQERWAKRVTQMLTGPPTPGTPDDIGALVGAAIDDPLRRVTYVHRLEGEDPGPQDDREDQLRRTRVATMLDWPDYFAIRSS